MSMTRSENMSRIRSKDTSIELIVRKKLWSLGFRYRKNYKKIIGCPDICFVSKKVAVFLDSEFWHGKTYQETGKLPSTNTEYWKNKIEKNILRDKKVNKELEQNGWTVIRLWEKDIRADLETCIKAITVHL